MPEKCPYSSTQNANESFHAMIWNCVPKPTYFWLDVLSISVYDAIEYFNNDEKTALDIIELLKIYPELLYGMVL